MTRTRKWVSGTAVLVLIVLVAGWFLLISPKKSDAASLQSQALGVQATNDGLRAKVADLKAKAAAKPQQEAKLALFRQQVPETPAEPSLVRTVSGIAKQANVQFESLNVVNPTGVNVPAAPAAEKDTVLKQMTVTMTVEGSYYAAERFLNLVEGLKRVMLVTGVNIVNLSDVQKNGGPDTTQHKYIITARVFLATNPPAGAVVAPTTTAPATSGNATPTTVQ